MTKAELDISLIVNYHMMVRSPGCQSATGGNGKTWHVYILHIYIKADSK